MPINPKSLENLHPRLLKRGKRERLNVYLPVFLKDWLKKKENASLKIELMFEAFIRLKLLLDKIKNNYSGYRVNSFTRGVQELQEIAEILEEIE